MWNSPDDKQNSAASWSWLLATPHDELGKYSRPRWVRDAYDWRRERCAGCAPTGLFSFPRFAVPVLTVDTEGNGLLCLIHADPEAGNRDDMRAGALEEAAIRLFNAADERLAHYWSDPAMRNCPIRLTGDSHSLPAFMHFSFRILGLEWPDTICATGGWDGEQFTPVKAETLPGKVRCAREWGFRTIIVVEGQESVPMDAGLTVSSVPPSPLRALIAVLEIVFADGDDGLAPRSRVDQALVAALRLLDAATVRANPNTVDFDAGLTIAQRFSALDYPNTAFLAHDIRARAFLRKGATREAEREYALSRQCLAAPRGPLDDDLGMYIEYEVHAHAAVIAVDQGRWDDDEAEHRRLDFLIASLETPPGATLIRNMEMALRLRSMRSMRLRFLGRLLGDEALLLRSLADLQRYEGDAQELAAFAVEKRHDRNCGDRRRHNYIIDTLTDLNALDPAAFARVRSAGEHLWPSLMSSPREHFPLRHYTQGEGGSEELLLARHELKPRPTAYDYSYWLKWKALYDFGGVTADDVLFCLETAAESLRNDKHGLLRYPLTLIPENILRFHLGDETCRTAAIALLERAEYFMTDPDMSILAILALRAGELIAHEPAFFHDRRGVDETGTSMRLSRLRLDILAQAEKTGRPLVELTPY